MCTPFMTAAYNQAFKDADYWETPVYTIFFRELLSEIIAVGVSFGFAFSNSPSLPLVWKITPLQNAFPI